MTSKGNGFVGGMMDDTVYVLGMCLLKLAARDLIRTRGTNIQLLQFFLVLQVPYTVICTWGVHVMITSSA